MDHELKQRLIGAVVVTALAAIFIPMLFDDPVDTSGKTVTELAIPQAPSDSASETAKNLPENKEQVLNKSDTELSVSESEEIEQPPASVEKQGANNPAGSQTVENGNETLDTKPVDDSGDPEGSQQTEPTLDTGIVEENEQDGSHQKQITEPVVPVKKPKPVLEAAPKKPVVSEKPKVKTVAVTEKTKAKPLAEKAATQKSASKLVRYSIQAGSFSKKENAQALVEKLRKQGLPASMTTKGNLYRVKVGPELDKKKATEMKAKLDKQNISSLLTSE